MIKSPFVIAISGDPASGKTTAIDALADKYEQEGFCIGERREGKCVIRLASGQMFREIANNAGITLQELNTFAKQPGNTLEELKGKVKSTTFFDNLSPELLQKSVDSFVDEYVLNHIEMLKTKYMNVNDVIIIVDSRVAGLLMRNSGRDVMNIRFCAKPEIAALRALNDAENRVGEVNTNFSKREHAYMATYESLRSRTYAERARFIQTYSKDPFNPFENSKVDLQNYDNYNLIIDTTGTTIEKELVVLYTCIEKAREGKEYNKMWCSTKYIYPGCTPTEEDIPLDDNGFHVIEVDKQYYAMNSLHFIGLSNSKGYNAEKTLGNESGYALIPVRILAQDNQLAFVEKGGHIYNFQANTYVKENITSKLISNFEKQYKFKYPKIGVTKLKDLNRSTSEFTH